MKRKYFGFLGMVLFLVGLLTACSSSASDEIAVGNQAPNFSLSDSGGKHVTLAEYKGQAVLLFFHMAGG